MAVAPSIFYSMLMMSSLLATPDQPPKTSSPLFLIGSPSRALVLYTISSMLRCYLTNMGSSCHNINTFNLTKTQMFGINPFATPLATSYALTLNIGSIIFDPSKYRIMVVHLQYLSLTCLNIAYMVIKLSQFMHQPAIEH